jgi:hypothetical protein
MKGPTPSPPPGKTCSRPPLSTAQKLTVSQATDVTGPLTARQTGGQSGHHDDR